MAIDLNSDIIDDLWKTDVAMKDILPKNIDALLLALVTSLNSGRKDVINPFPVLETVYKND